MLYIKANHLTDGLYNIKDGEIFKYKAKGGTVRTYEIGNIVRCKECKHNYNKVLNHGKMKPRCDFTDRVLTENDFCSRGEREGE